HALAELGAAGERVAAEVIRLQATETAELSEPHGPASVGSSTMPQKRNPMTSEYVVASARLLRGAVSVLLDAPAHSGERDMGAWAAEWVAVPQALILAGGVVEKLATILEGLVVHEARMTANPESRRARGSRHEPWDGTCRRDRRRPRARRALLHRRARAGARRPPDERRRLSRADRLSRPRDRDCVRGGAGRRRPHRTAGV